MKKLSIIFILILISISSLSQSNEYLDKLALYLSEFKNNAYYDDIRSRIFDDVSSLKNQVEIHLNLSELNTPYYQNYLSIKRKISAFYNFLRCLEHGACEIEEFEYITSLLDIIPNELNYLKCENASFFELSFNEFKAILVFNHNKDQTIPMQNAIHVEYSELINGKVESGAFMNVGANKVRCINYRSDKHTFYNKIVAVRCE